ncbi:hypothetical protein ACOSP7_001517 [Xanthoceras sorbifolium]
MNLFTWKNYSEASFWGPGCLDVDSNGHVFSPINSFNVVFIQVKIDSYVNNFWETSKGNRFILYLTFEVEQRKSSTRGPPKYGPLGLAYVPFKSSNVCLEFYWPAEKPLVNEDKLLFVYFQRWIIISLSFMKFNEKVVLIPSSTSLLLADDQLISVN